MQIKIRSTINPEGDLESKSLTVFENIVVGIKKSMLQRDSYIRKLNTEEEEAYIEKSKLKSKCKDDLLRYSLQYLLNNTGLPDGQEDQTIEQVTFEVPRVYQQVLGEVLSMKEFNSFITEVVPDDNDILLSFPNKRITLIMRRKNI